MNPWVMMSSSSGYADGKLLAVEKVKRKLGHSRECCKHLPLLCDNVTASVSYSLAVII